MKPELACFHEASCAIKKLGRPCSTDAGETRERLIHEARASFATIGYDATTNRTVAAAAGITTGAIYHYFPSKLDMYVAAFEQVQNMVTEAVVAAAAPCESLVDKFSAIIDALTDVSKNDPSLLGFVVGVSAEARRHPELSVAIRPLRKEWAVFSKNFAKTLLLVEKLDLKCPPEHCKICST